MRAPSLLLALAACAPGADAPPIDDTDPVDTDPADTDPLDADGDGVPAALDCDDADPRVHPGAPELCDGRPNDCDDAGWTLAREAGTATHTAPDGVATDVSATFGDGPLAAGTYDLCPGTFPAALTADGVEVALVGHPQPDGPVVLDGGGAGRVLTATDSALTLTRLTLQDGAVEGDGGLVQVTGGALDMTEVALSQAQATRGGALYLEGVDAGLTRVSVQGVTAQDGGGIFILGGAVTLTDVSISDATATATGGGLAWRLADPGADALTATGLQVREAQAEEGGGLHLQADAGDAPFPVQLTAPWISACTGGSGAGVYTSRVALTIDGGTLLDNAAAGFGGGIYASGGHLTLDDVAAERNTAVAGGFLYGSAELTARGGSWSSNQAIGSGGAAALRGPTASLSDLALTGNTASQGGALAVVDGEANLTGVIVDGNHSTDVAGGVWVQASVADATVTLARTTLSGNSALNGGGAALHGVTGVAALHLTDGAALTGNTAYGTGGAAHLAGRSALVCGVEGADEGAAITANRRAALGDAAGVRLTDEAELTLWSCDLGAPGTPDDNTPTATPGASEDVVIGAQVFAFGDDATAVCVATGGCEAP